MRNRVPGRWGEALRRGRRGVLAVAALLTAFFAWHLVHLRVDPSNESMIPRGDPAYGRLLEFRRLFGGDEFIVAAFHALREGGAPRMEGLERIADRIRRLDHVRRVQSPLRPSGSEKRPLRPAEARRALSENPSYTGLLSSNGGRTLALLAWLDPVDGDDRYRAEIVREVRRLVSGARREGIEVYVAGIPVQKNDISAYVLGDQALIIPLVFLFFTAFIYLVYRSAAVTALSMGLVGLGLIWTLGFYSWMGGRLNTVSGLLSPLLMIVTLESAVHYLNQYARQCARRADPEEAMAAALDAVIAPCFLAALTTAGGLVTIATLGVPAVREFGLFASAGVGFSFVLSMSAFPLLVRRFAGRGAPLPAEPCPAPVQALLDRAARISGRAPAGVLLAALVLAAAALAGLPRLVVDTDITGALRPSAPLHAATRFIDREMVGVNPLEILVERIDGSSLLDARILEKVARLQDFLDRQPEINKSISVVDRISYIFQGPRRGRPREVPRGNRPLKLMEQIVRNSPELQEQLRPWVDEKFTRLRVSARVHSVGSVAGADLVRRIEDYARRNLDGVLRIRMTGNFILLNNMSNDLVARQVRSLLYAAAFVLAAVGILFRSVRIALLAAVPNLLPIGAVFGLMGWLGIPLSVPTAMISSISLGLVVDNTIHFLYFFRRLRGEGAEWKKAARETVRTTGRPIAVSAIVLVGGFWVGVIGSFLPVVYFSLFTGLTILIAVLCNLIVLPAMLQSARALWEG